MILEIIVEKDESGYYVGEVPALPGCFSQGKTVKELKVNITEAIEGWLEVKCPPKPPKSLFLKIVVNFKMEVDNYDWRIYSKGIRRNRI